MASPLDLERLYDDHAQSLFAYLLNLTRNETDTHDLLQELFLKLANRPGLLNGGRDERAFFLRLAHNLAIDLMRRRATREKNYATLASESAALFAPSIAADDQVIGERLSAALGELPLAQRAVVHLK